MGSRRFTVDDLNVTAMGQHEFHHNGKAYARSLYMSSRSLAGVEGIEHLTSFLQGYSRTAIGHFQNQ